jgi:hypothetical protein
MMKLGTGASLPRLSLSRLDGPGRVAWSQGPMAAVVFVPHLDPCPECHVYLEELGAAASGLREWATRALILAGTNWPPESPPGVVPLDDRAGTGRGALGLDSGQAAVLQADRWGALYQSEIVGAGASHHDLPTAADLVAMAKYIDIQCPECGIPSREWQAVTPFPLG